MNMNQLQILLYPSTSVEFVLGGALRKLQRSENNEISYLIRTLGGEEPKEYK